MAELTKEHFDRTIAVLAHTIEEGFEAVSVKDRDRRQLMEQALQETIHVLQQTKGTFRSKALRDLRKRVERVLLQG